MPTQKISAAVEDSRKEFQKALGRFSQRAEALVNKANRTTMTLRDVNTARDLIREGIQNTEEFYIAGETIILSLDAFCRPMLAEDPSAQVVGAVSDLMQEIIKEMDGTTTTFTVGLNGVTLGDVGEVAPKPGMEARVVQRYWEQQYRTMPGYAEDQQRRQAEVQAQKQREAQAAQAAKAAGDQAKAQLDALQAKSAAVLERKNAMAARCRKAEKEFLDSATAYLGRYRSELEKNAAAEAAALQKKAQELRQKRKSCKGSDRADVDFAISRTDAEYNAVTAPGYIEAQMALCKKKLEDAVAAYKAQLDVHLAQCYTSKTESISIKMSALPTGGKNTQDELENAILDTLSWLGWSTVSQIAENIPGGYTNVKISATLRRLMDRGLVSRVEDSRKAMFGLAGTPFQSNLEVWTENTKLASGPLPAPAAFSIRAKDLDVSDYISSYCAGQRVMAEQKKKSLLTKIVIAAVLIAAVGIGITVSQIRSNAEAARVEEITVLAETELNRSLQESLGANRFYDDDFYTATEISATLVEVIYVPKKELLHGGKAYYQVRMRIDCTMTNTSEYIKDSELTGLLASDIKDELPHYLGEVDGYPVYLHTQSIKNSDKFFGGKPYEYNSVYLVDIYINGIKAMGPSL